MYRSVITLHHKVVTQVQLRMSIAKDDRCCHWMPELDVLLNTIITLHLMPTSDIFGYKLSKEPIGIVG